MQRFSHRFIAAVMFLFWMVGIGSQGAEASLILSLDTVTKTYSLSGSTTLTTFFGDESTFVLWAAGSNPAPGPTIYSPVMATSSPIPIEATFLRLYDGFVDVIFDFGSEPVTLVTIEGNSVKFSYASASTAQANNFESLIGSSIPLVQGTGGEGILVRAAAVPEPASIAIWSLLGSIMVYFGWFRPRRSEGSRKTRTMRAIQS